jgi:hypothetical protein
MALIKGITVTLYERTQTGTDDFNCPVYTETPVTVDNVLVAPAQSDDIPRPEDLEAKKAVFRIAIPKGDLHEWEDCRVDFFNESWKVTGLPEAGIEDLIPLDWNRIYKVERYG